MRILIVTMFGFNDAFKFSHQDQTASTLTHLGHEMTCYAYLDKKNPLHNKIIEEREGVKVRRFLPPKHIFSKKLRKALREDGPYDVIHLHHLRNKFSYEITQYSLRENIPLIFEPHGLLHDPYLVKNRDFPFSGPILEDNIILTKAGLFKKVFTRGPLPGYFKNYSRHFVFKKARVLLALSNHEKDLLKRITNRPDIEILPHWIDRDVIDKVEKRKMGTVPNFSKRPLILFVGQLKYRRGFDIAVKILARLKRKNSSTTLIVVTNNTDKKKELLDLANREGVAQSIVLKENISEEEKFSLYKEADFYLSPTRYEGFGVTFLEAMACGCPIVTSDIPVVREIVEHERTGLLARLEDPYDFSKAINRLLNDHALRKNIIKNSLQKAEKEYNKEKIFSKLVNIYKSLQRVGV